jgi:hypothetical protein
VRRGSKLTGALTAADIHAALKQRFHWPSTEWALIEELRTGSGYRSGSENYIDAFVVNCFPSTGLKRIAYEVKISRSDFTRELRQPLKRKVALLYSNQFFFAAPFGIIKPEDLPPEAGLIEVRPNPCVENRERWPWDVKVAADAPWRDTPPPSWALFASVARRLAEAEYERGRANRELLEARR